MTRTVRILRRAERDLQEVYDLVVREAPRRADRFIDDLLAASASLSARADRGASPRDPALRARGFRFLVHGRYLVFYQVTRTGVRVYRVVHGHRAYRGLL